MDSLTNELSLIVASLRGAIVDAQHELANNPGKVNTSMKRLSSISNRFAGFYKDVQECANWQIIVYNPSIVRSLLEAGIEAQTKANEILINYQDSGVKHLNLLVRVDESPEKDFVIKAENLRKKFE